MKGTLKAHNITFHILLNYLRVLYMKSSITECLFLRYKAEVFWNSDDVPEKNSHNDVSVYPKF